MLGYPSKSPVHLDCHGQLRVVADTHKNAQVGLDMFSDLEKS